MSEKPPTTELSYKDSGVDIDSGQELVRRIRTAVSETKRPEIIGGVGDFAALSRIPSRYRNPVLVSGTDGVGTKLELAIALGRHEVAGQDLVAMCVNDVITTGAEPLLFLDYLAVGKLDVDVAEQIVVGIARACGEAGCSLVGGETAEMPGYYAHGTYDIAGFCVGVVEEDLIKGQSAVSSGDVLLGLASNGPHSNGYSLIRRILANTNTPVEQLPSSCMNPTRIYAKPILAVADSISSMANITGGGLVENIPRMLPPDLYALIDRRSWSRPEVFDWIQQMGPVNELEMLRTFNCGIGFVVAIAEHSVDEVQRTLDEHSVQSTVIGIVTADRNLQGEDQLLLGHDLAELT